MNYGLLKLLLMMVFDKLLNGYGLGTYIFIRHHLENGFVNGLRF